MRPTVEPRPRLSSSGPLRAVPHPTPPPRRWEHPFSGRTSGNGIDPAPTGYESLREHPL
ncbi:hypothetical protein B005_2350 [Nocardiopsis alba ATCC BAA-2165]|uniref:Uncharacterized protein n=1 Tax=Nocardiopsis alba (strain ATCC BAA-2165 / BE74) TaxID=1205910 RepID=J7LBF1_NOCAA|nr:hypothetical protein B005_2350 [Nocardiopsis alba ATCC BAA-2165]